MSEHTFNRRDFLKWSTLIAASATLQACAPAVAKKIAGNEPATPVEITPPTEKVTYTGTIKNGCSNQAFTNEVELIRQQDVFANQARPFTIEVSGSNGSTIITEGTGFYSTDPKSNTIKTSLFLCDPENKPYQLIGTALTSDGSVNFMDSKNMNKTVFSFKLPESSDSSNNPVSVEFTPPASFINQDKFPGYGDTPIELTASGDSNLFKVEKTQQLEPMANGMAFLNNEGLMGRLQIDSEQAKNLRTKYLKNYLLGISVMSPTKNSLAGDQTDFTQQILNPDAVSYFEKYFDRFGILIDNNSISAENIDQTTETLLKAINNSKKDPNDEVAGYFPEGLPMPIKTVKNAAVEIVAAPEFWWPWDTVDIESYQRISNLMQPIGNIPGNEVWHMGPVIAGIRLAEVKVGNSTKKLLTFLLAGANPNDNLFDENADLNNTDNLKRLNNLLISYFPALLYNMRFAFQDSKRGGGKRIVSARAIYNHDGDFPQYDYSFDPNGYPVDANNNPVPFVVTSKNTSV